MQELRSRLGERARWFRVGVVSATVLTPLVRRWQTLRAAERARALWDASRSGAAWPRRRHEETPALPPLARRSNLSTGLWLAGVGVGLVAAGTAAYFVARRRMAAREEAPVELSLSSPNGANGALSMDVVEGNPVLAATASARPPRHADDSHPRSRHDTAQRENTPDSGAAPAPTSPDGEAASTSAPLAESASAGAMAPEQAPFIGDIHSLVYHEAGDENLPAEPNRVYFATREEAESAGYHASRNETLPGETTP